MMSSFEIKLFRALRREHEENAQEHSDVKLRFLSTPYSARFRASHKPCEMCALIDQAEKT